MFLVNPLCFNFVCDRVVLYVHRAVALISPHLNFLMETCTCPRPPLRTLSAYIPSLSSTSHPLATWCSHMTSGTKPTSSCRRSKVSQNSKQLNRYNLLVLDITQLPGLYYNCFLFLFAGFFDDLDEHSESLTLLCSIQDLVCYLQKVVEKLKDT